MPESLGGLPRTGSRCRHPSPANQEHPRGTGSPPSAVEVRGVMAGLLRSGRSRIRWEGDEHHLKLCRARHAITMPFSPCVFCEEDRSRANRANLSVGSFDLELPRQIYRQDAPRRRMPIADPARWDPFEAVLRCRLERGEQHRWRVLEVVGDFLERYVDVFEVRLAVVVGEQAQKLHPREDNIADRSGLPPPARTWRLPVSPISPGCLQR